MSSVDSARESFDNNGSSHTGTSKVATSYSDVKEGSENESPHTAEVSSGIEMIPNNQPSGHMHEHKEAPLAEFVEDVGAEVEINVKDEQGGEVRKRLDGVLHRDGRREILAKNCYNKLGYCFPLWRKLLIITVIFWVQMSMNFNTSVYPNAVPLISESMGIETPKVQVSQMLFLVLYAFGCELWAPWSEEFGRWPIMQLSLFFVNIWQILGALAPNYGSICVARALGGLSSAGGSVTLAMVADMWEPNDQGYAVAYVVLSSVGGTVIGPIFGGLIGQYLKLEWNFWIQLIFGGVVQLMHLILVPETRSTILMDREAKRRRKSGEDKNIYGPNEIKEKRIEFGEILTIWMRPFVMFVKEPIVLCMSLLSGFSDCLIFIFTASLSGVYEDGWEFNTVQCGLVFISIGVGYIIGYIFHNMDTWRQMYVLHTRGDAARHAERRLLMLLFLAPLEPIGLFIFGWTSFPKDMGLGIPWIAPTIAVALVGIANYSIYMGSIDYMILAYGPYSASATGGNGFSRDFLAGISALYSQPLYNNIGTLHYQWASTLLGVLGIFVVIPVYIFYWKGPLIRKKSKFAQSLAADRQFEDMSNSDDEKSTLKSPGMIDP